VTLNSPSASMGSHTETPPSPASPRWTRSAALVGGWVLIVLLLLYFLELRPRSRTEAPSVATVPTVQPDFPAPPEGAVVYSRELGDKAVALAVVPGMDEVIVQASVVGPRGDGISGLGVSFGAQGSTFSGRSCGAGCYRAGLPTSGAPRAIDVVVEGDSTMRWSVALPETWPPTDATRVLMRAERAWRGLRSLSFDETLRSDERHILTSSWQTQAPDRLAYQIPDGASAVVVGKRRWDKVPGEPWEASAQLPLRQPRPPWVRAVNARVVGTTLARGRPALVVTFFDPGTPAWYAAILDRETFRTYDLRMIAAAHFMHDRFHSFNETPAIRPPS
jgi:hypothetical protein